MRRWGYGLAGLLAFALFVSATNPSNDSIPVATQSTFAAESSPTPEESNAPEPRAQPESLTSTSDSEPEPIESTTEEMSDPAPVTQEADPQEPEATSTTAAPASAPTSTPSPTQAAVAPEPELTGFEVLLASLVIAEESPSGYDRDLFRHWVDDDRDGCDARREVLIIEAVVAPVVGAGCSFSGGSWYSAFDGVTTEDPGVFDIDHMVPLKEAWDSGAHAWTSDQRRAFANDLDLPEALIAVSRSSNRSKSDRDPADWLPSLRSYQCQYVQDWMVVKIKWELSVDSREFSALRSVAAGC